MTGPPAKVLFSTFDVTRQVFFYSALSAGIVNLKPLMPGHVLLISRRVVPRLADLEASEVTDLFNSVQQVGKVIEREYGAQGLNVAVQDGAAAGQSVPHVHVHILPRQVADFGGNSDAVYPLLEASEGGLVDDLRKGGVPEPFVQVRDEDRHPRTPEDMEKEALHLAGLFATR